MAELLTQENVRVSLIRYFIEKHGINTILIFDGVEYPDAKPFMTVHQMQNNSAVLSKGRESIQTTYRFQVGLFTEHPPQQAQLQEQVYRGLLFDDIPLYNAGNPGSDAEGFFIVQGDIPVTPISAEDVSDKTQYNRVYFDVAVEATLRRT